MYEPPGFNERYESAWRCIKNSDWRMAANMLQSALATDVDRNAGNAGKALALLGYVLLKLDDPKQAVAAYVEARRINPDIPRVRSALGFSLMLSGQELKAIGVLEEAANWDRNLTQIHFNLGNLHARRADHAKAESALRAGLLLDPKHVGSVTNLGCLLVKGGQLGEAIEQLSKAVKLAPRSWDAGMNLALAFGKAACWDEAIDQLNSLVREFFDEPRSRVLLARVYRCAGRGQAALSHLDDSIEWGAWNGARYEISGLIHADAGNRDQALAFYEEAVDAQPGKARYRADMAELLLGFGELDRAHQKIVEAIGVSERRSASWVVKGRINFEMNRLDEALKAIQKSLSLNDQLHEAHYWEGRIHLRSSNRRAAMASYKKLCLLKSPLSERLRPLLS